MHKKQIFILIPAIAVFFFMVSTLIVEPSVGLTEKNQIIEENDILMTFSRIEEKKPNLVKVVVTAYSSTEWQTDEDPFVTASGITVKEGIIANNMLPFGTEIKIPEYFGDRVFVVEDRMNRRKGLYWVDVWFPSTEEAEDFGIKEAYIEVLEI